MLKKVVGGFIALYNKIYELLKIISVVLISHFD